ncbi:MAG: AMP-binding protein [Oscillospiraceae bacterium]|nr:AMP-binding protein [Oscillospiraceae bacterium]
MDLSFLNGTKYILDAWSEYVADKPAALALTDERHPRGLSRRQVDELSGRVYAWLKEKKIGREDFVFLCLPRGAAPLIALLGVWKAGAAFTMVEDNYPPERIAYIRKDCSCKAVIDGDAWEEILKTEPKPGYEKTDPRDAAFAVYTSGTTGNPKGALHEYGSIRLIQASSLDPRTGKPRLGESDRMALIPPLNFVAAIRRFIYAVYDGCHVFVVPYSIIKNPVLLRQFYQDKRITFTYCSPSLIRLVGDPGPTIRQIQIGGEPANGIFVEGKELVNGYSMSECGFPLAEFLIDKPYEPCPVGKPDVPEIVLSILDEDGKEVPDGTEGEICVEDPFFRGYINLPDKTGEALRGGVYHTGDIGKKLPDGNLVLLGRSTDMIKINGNRIEPAEIEAVGKKVLGVKWCAAKGFEDPAHAFVCLYYTEDIRFDELDVRHQMEQYLPYYMIPSYFVKVDAVPLLPNGKMNRRALPKPEAKAELAEYAPPRTETEKLLCRAFEQALQLDRVGIRDNFYHLGGDSLGTMRVLAAADLQGLLAADIFEGCTPERIAAIWEERKNGAVQEDAAVTEKRERKKAHPLTPNQISIFDYCIFSPNTIMWNLPRLYRFPADTDAERLCDAVNRALANRPALYTVFEFNRECSLVQRTAPEKALKLSVEKLSEAAFARKKKDLLHPFRMVGEPLIHAGLWQTEKAVYLFFDVHHIMTDGSGMQLLNGDIVRAWNGEALAEDTYYTYLYRQEQLRAGKKYREDRKFFEERYGKDDWCINLIPDVQARPAGRTLLPLERTVSPEEMKAYEERTHVSRNILFTALGLLGIYAEEKKSRVMLDWIFHDRTDAVRQNAFGCLFRYVTVGLEIGADMTLRDFTDAVSDRSNDSLAHCAYEWSVMKDNVFEHDMMIVCYETAEIMSGSSIGSIGGTRLNVTSHAPINSRSLAFQIIENPDGIVPYLMFNQAIYSEEKIGRTVELFSKLLDSILKADDPGQLKLSQLTGGIAG